MRGRVRRRPKKKGDRGTNYVGVLLTAHAPTQPSADADKDTFYQQLDSLISAIPPHDTTIILGDFNAVTGSDTYIHTFFNTTMTDRIKTQELI